MHTRTVIAAITLPALLSSCSQPAAERAKTSERQQQELALTAAPENAAVASPLELTQPATEKNEAPRKTLASRQQATKRAVQVATQLPDIDTRIHASPATISTAPAVTDVPLIALPQSGPSVSQGEEPAADGVGHRPEPILGRPGIIIRGGRGGGADPCDIHDTRGRGGIPPVLINPRVPGVGLPTAPRGGGLPAGPRGAGGGGIRF